MQLEIVFFWHGKEIHKNLLLCMAPSLSIGVELTWLSTEANKLVYMHFTLEAGYEPHFSQNFVPSRSYLTCIGQACLDLWCPTLVKD